MKIKQGQLYFIDVRVVDGKRYYSYSANVIIPFEEASTCEGTELFGKPNERIKISKKAWKLAALRCHPGSESGVTEIISYSKGERISLSFIEKVILAITHG